MACWGPLSERRKPLLPGGNCWSGLKGRNGGAGDVAAEREVHRKGKLPFGVWLEHSRWPAWLLSIMGFSYIMFWFYGQGFLEPEYPDLCLFTLALSLHDTPMHSCNLWKARPGLLTGSSSSSRFMPVPRVCWLPPDWRPRHGLGSVGGRSDNLPHPDFSPCGGAESLCPTSGGAWEVQGPGGQAARTWTSTFPGSSSLSSGEMTGNVVHPFWTIPLMGICGLSVRDIMGYV